MLAPSSDGDLSAPDARKSASEIPGEGDPHAPHSGELHARQERSSAQLSDREREVLALVGEGLANKQIARRLGITERTVKAHLTNVFQRIGVRDRTSAALWAKRNLSH